MRSNDGAARTFDVLVDLYDHRGGFGACPDADSLTRKLAAAGFDDDEIIEALDWLQGLARVTRE